MDLDYISPMQASEKWGVTERQVQSLCKQGKIKEIIRWGRSWLIHKDAAKPIDGRIKNGKKRTSNSKE